MQAKLHELEAPNGGRNYNGPKVAKFLSGKSRPARKARNDLGTVSTRDSVKFLVPEDAATRACDSIPMELTAV